MSNCDYGSSGSELFKRLLNLLFRFGVERRRRLIEKKDRRVFQDGARNREALLLTTREKTAFVANDRIVTLWLRHDEIVSERRHFQNRADLQRKAIQSRLGRPSQSAPNPKF